MTRDEFREHATVTIEGCDRAAMRLARAIRANRAAVIAGDHEQEVRTHERICAMKDVLDALWIPCELTDDTVRVNGVPVPIWD